MRTNLTEAQKSQDVKLKQGLLVIIAMRYSREIIFTTSLFIWTLLILIYLEFRQQLFFIQDQGLKIITVILIYGVRAFCSFVYKFRQDKHQSIYGYTSAIDNARSTIPFALLILFSQESIWLILGHLNVLFMLGQKIWHLIYKYNPNKLKNSLKDGKLQNYVWVSINVLFYLKVLGFRFTFLGQQNQLMENIILSFLCVLLCLIIKIKSGKIHLSKPFYRLVFIKITLARFFSCYFTFIFVASGLTQTTVLILLVLLGLNLCFMLQFRQLSQILYFAEYQQSFCIDHLAKKELAAQMEDSTNRIWLLLKNCEASYKQREICYKCMEQPADMGFFMCQHFLFCQKCVRGITKKSSRIEWYCPVCKALIGGYIITLSKNQEKIAETNTTKGLVFRQRIKSMTSIKLQTLNDFLQRN